ncbi:MAG: dual specificity protein phosphatase family protein [Planctomycetes bacterium]|nr:dual specificity protein phosphatase family protein [Planctomycetota bacterium]
MREVLPGRLWRGNVADLSDPREVLNAGILAVVDLAHEELPPTLPRSMVYCRFPIVDGEQDSRKVLRTAIETLVSLLEEEMPTLVYCRAGMSRSPAVVAAALSIYQEESPGESLRRVVAGHPHDVSARLWQDVHRVCEEIGGSR